MPLFAHFLRNFRLPFFYLAVVSLAGCSSRPIGLHDDEFTACPSSPNCISSDSSHPKHRIDPFYLTSTPQRAWQKLYEIVVDWPEMDVVERTPVYLHAEARSKVFKFVDDVEFNLRADEGIIAVKSRSRTGYYDFDTNRERIEALRDALRAEGVVE